MSQFRQSRFCTIPVGFDGFVLTFPAASAASCLTRLDQAIALIYLPFAPTSMTSPYKGQTKAKTVFLLASAVGWLIVGASLIYLVPAGMDQFRPTALTHTWMETLGRSGYNPMLAIVGGGIAFTLTVIGNAVWYRSFEKNTQ